MSTPKNVEAIRETLTKELDQAQWVWLARHAERDAVILVAAGLDLVEVGVKVALDDTAAVGAWVTAQQLTKPTRDQLDAWNAEPTRPFMSLVVQPYVLIQELAH